MLFSFRAEGLKEEFEIFGAAGESVAGLFDTLRSAAVDLTADAVVLAEAAASTAAALAESGLAADSKRAVAVEAQRAKAKAFADSPVEVYLAGDDGLPVFLCRFPEGLRATATAAAAAACELARSVLAKAGPATVETLAALDRAFDPSVLPRRAPTTAAAGLEVPAEGIEGGGGDFDADELLTGTESASKLGGKGALKIKKGK
jgi:hypothetical protein